MYRGPIYVGRRGIAIHAISGVDIALWDLKGKALGCARLGAAREPVRDRVRAYASRLMPDTTARSRTVVADLRAAGFTAVKLGWGPLGQDADHDIALAAAARDAGGPGFDVMIDAGLATSPTSRRPSASRARTRSWDRLARGAVRTRRVRGLRGLADRVDLPIAAGEQDATRWGFRELIERGHVDVVQPDVTRAGGITETLRIAALAREHGVPTVPTPGRAGSSRPPPCT